MGLKGPTCEKKEIGNKWEEEKGSWKITEKDGGK
jgi:hypothetical protein